jgi:alpha-D-xyloside xylohydrolase
VKRLAILLCAACGDNLEPPAVPLASGPATISIDNGALTFARDGQTLLAFHAASFQIGTVDDLDSGDSFDPYYLFLDPPMPPTSLQWRVAGSLAIASSSDAQLVIALAADGANGTVTIAPAAPGCFTLVLAATSTTSQSVAYLRVRPDADATEGFYGLGEWGDAVDNRGTLRPMQMEADLTSESSDNEDHVPVPLVIGTRGWGAFVQSDRPGAFDVARQSPTLVDITFGTGDASPDGLTVQLFSADQPLDILARYFDLTGYPGVPAPWAYGPLLWRDENSNQAQVIDDISQIRTRHLAASGMWFDRPYATGVETFDFDPVKFPDPPTMLQALHDAGLRYGVWHAPYVAPAGNSEDPAGTQNAYADAHGFFPPTTAVFVNPWGKPIDFTNPDAYAWWQQNLASYTALGIEGFKLDYGEDVVVGLLGARVPWLFADGSDERTMHRGYQLLYHRVYRELLDPAGAFVLARTGRWGDQIRGTIIWPGDLDASFAQRGDPLDGKGAVGGLPAALIEGLSLSASGFPFYASDTAGYRHSPAPEECWVRWVEANAVASAMNIGDASSEQPWEFTADNGRTQTDLDRYARYTLLHLRLFPYAWTYAQQIAATGRPIARPFGLAWPAMGQQPNDEYMFGDALLVAPVVSEGATSRMVWFPPGTWIDWWTGAPIAGGAQEAVDADLDTLPLFLAAGSIVPMLRDTIETLAPTATADSFATSAGILTARVAPGPASSFTVYDGTELAQAPGTLAYTPGTVFAQGARFELIATPMPASVHANGVVLPQAQSLAALDGSGWFWEPATGGTLWILVPGAATITVP